jgi:hypothetical protein
MSKFNDRKIIAICAIISVISAVVVIVNTIISQNADIGSIVSIGGTASVAICLVGSYFSLGKKKNTGE